MGKTSKTAAPANEGEGNRTAAREFNAAQQRFAQSGQVEEKAREAEQALDGPERQALEEAVTIGKSHSAGEDPEVMPDPGPREDEKIRSRAYDIWEREGQPAGRHIDHWLQAERETAG